MEQQFVRLSTDLAPGDLHHDALLTNILVGYRPRGMIAPQIFPTVTVGKQSDRFGKVDRGAWFRRPTTLRAVGATAREVRYTVSSDSYRAENYELGTVCPWETIDNADQPFRPMELYGQFLIDQLMLDYEMRVREFTVGGVGSTTALTGANALNAYATSDPLGVFDAVAQTMRGQTGYKPNVCIVPDRTWVVLRRHPDIIRAIFPGAGVGGVAAPEQFASLVGVERVLIPEAITNTAREDTTTGDPAGSLAFTDIWSTDITFAYVTPTPGLMVPTFGYTFLWTGANIGQNRPGNFSVMRGSEPKRKSEWLQTGYYQDEKIVAVELGHNIQTGITA